MLIPISLLLQISSFSAQNSPLFIQTTPAEHVKISHLQTLDIILSVSSVCSTISPPLISHNCWNDRFSILISSLHPREAKTASNDSAKGRRVFMVRILIFNSEFGIRNSELFYPDRGLILKRMGELHSIGLRRCASISHKFGRLLTVGHAHCRTKVSQLFLNCT